MAFFTKKTQPKAVKQSPRFKLSTKHAWLLWLCQCLNIAVIAVELSPWMLATIIGSFILQAFLIKRHSTKVNTAANKVGKIKSSGELTFVSPIVLALFALTGCLAIGITGKDVGVLGSMLHLLCFSYALKAFEIKTRADFYQIILLGLFVLSSSIIFRQDLAFTFLVITLLIINLVVLLRLFSAEQPFTTGFKTIAVLLGQSAILAVVLFLVFPRIAPFWQVPSAKSAETGLSDSVKPGDIANLSRSTKLAFRADFGNQRIPEYSQLYWRAMVLEDYDGRQWTKNNRQNTSKAKGEANQAFTFDSNNNSAQALTYQVIAEASFQKYLFALAPAVVLEPSSGIKSHADFTFTSADVITQAKSYSLTSYLSEPLSLNLDESSRAVNVNYPQSSNPRLEALAKQLALEYPHVKDRAQAILNLIFEQPFSYTLQPPLLVNNSLDQFFFDTQAGFCVHYASAFTFLMRASGVPARLVTGYLGGEYNGDENEAGHLSIYQYEAHAWSEIWIKDIGWMRIDPTGAVDPSRVNSGWSDDLLQQQSGLNNNLISLYQFKNIAWLNSLRLQFDALDYQWTRWVIGFTSDQQYNLLKHWFGKMVSWKLALIIAVSLIASMALLFLFLHLLNRSTQVQQPLTQWQKLYNKILTQLAKQGINKPVSMTVNAFAKQVREDLPELAITFTRFSGSYNALSYKSLSIKEEEKLLTAMQLQYTDVIKTLKKQG